MDILAKLLEYAAAHLSYYLEDISPNWKAEFPLSKQTTKEQIQESLFLLKEAILQKQEQGFSVRLNTVMHACKYEPIPLLAFGLSILTQQYPKIQSDLRAANIDAITLELVNDIYDVYLDNDDEPSFLALEENYLFITQFIFPKHTQLPFYQAPLVADERFIRYLCDSDILDQYIAEYSTMFFFDTPLQTLYIHQELVDALSSALATSEINPRPRLQLVGQSGVGKRLLLKHTFQNMRCDMIFVDLKYLLHNNPATIKELIKRIQRELVFYDCGIVLYGLDETLLSHTEDALTYFLQFCLLPLHKIDLPIVICSDDSVSMIPLVDFFMDNFTVPEPSHPQRVALWRGYCAAYNVDGLDFNRVGSKFKLSPAEIQKASQRLRHLKNRNIPLTEQLLSTICGQVLPTPSQGNIKKVNASYTLEDLKLPQEQKQSILNICAHVTNHFKVYDEWGMNQKYPYGKNVSALLVGPPGTGKTMAVHVISNILNLPLYKIDLSQVVDKYIGETEKRLEEIFTTAEKNNVILFFDEADSIFGKRSETNDAKDKYANTEVSYILQRMEQYEGIVLMATNYKKNIDEAFMRRIRYLIEFQLPNAELRKEIWQSSFSEGVPQEGIDFDFLARQFEFSGGSIKNIVLNATFLAAEHGTCVTMEHILKCIKVENKKMNKNMLRQDFAEYAHMVDVL